MIRALAIFALVVLSVRAQVLPSDRTVNWSTAGATRVVRTTISQTADAATYGNDSTDARAHLQAKLNATAAGQVCYIPAGIYRVNGGLDVPSNITVRGDGIDVTIIKGVGATGDNGIIQFGGFSSAFQWYPSTYSTPITAGNTIGSTSITVGNASAINVGDLICITGLNTAPEVNNTGYNGSTQTDQWGSSTGGAGTYTQNTRNRGQTGYVTAKTGNVLTLSFGLLTAYPTPWVTWAIAQGPRNSGVEELTVYATNTGSYRNFLFTAAYNCWLYNCKGDFADGDHVIVDWSANITVEGCWFKEGFVHGAGGYDTMVCLRTKATQCRIVNNIFERLHISVLTEWGAAANVIAYNYAVGEYDDFERPGFDIRALQMSLNGNHGAHPQFNLWEGNISSNFQCDSFWGTSSKTTVFRNRFFGAATSRGPYSVRGAATASYNLTQAVRAVNLGEGQTDVTLWANIIGSSGSATYMVSNPTARAYSPTVYDLTTGYAVTNSSGGEAILPNPSVTLINHANYFYSLGAQTFDGSIADHSIPDSLFLSSKPDFFGDRPWPLGNPASGTLTLTDHPAYYRYVNGVPPPSGGSPATPTNYRKTRATLNSGGF